MVGLACHVAEAIGRTAAPHVQAQLGEFIAKVELANGLLRASAQDVVAGRRDGTSLRALAATLWVFIPEAQMRAAEVIRHLFVVATYKAAGEVVGCKQFCGDLWNREQDRKTIEQSLTLQRAIEEEGKRLGLTVRAGMYQEAGAAS